MSRLRKVLIFSSIALTTAVLLVLGMVFSKTEEEKVNWLAEAYDVSEAGDLVFVKYNKGVAEIYQNTDGKVEFIVSLQAEKELLDITFTPSGSELVFSTTDWEYERLVSDVQSINLDTFEMELLFQLDGLVTEIQFDPKDEQKLYYLLAATNESYSPIAKAHPHDFDIYHVDLSTKKHFMHTNLKQYSMRSLQVSAEKEAIYVQMDDESQDEFDEGYGESKQRIFELPLEPTEEMIVLSDVEREADVFDFSLVEGEEAIVFQSIANYNSGDIFEYELYYYDLERKEEEALTNLASYVSRPVVVEAENKIYFMVNDNFGKSEIPDRSICSIDMDGDNLREINVTNE
ncbi:MAG TPA: hypothetical protein VFF20_09075 [Pseudogracilibacillus sp.]|nr:hypothetical protein [Pseudogracilibacillus sp.]